MEGYLVVTSIQAALLTVGLLSVSITLLHRAISRRQYTPRRRIEDAVLRQTG